VTPRPTAASIWRKARLTAPVCLHDGLEREPPLQFLTMALIAWLEAPDRPDIDPALADALREMLQDSQPRTGRLKRPPLRRIVYYR
jgi:hypothetical protein